MGINEDKRIIRQHMDYCNKYKKLKSAVKTVQIIPCFSVIQKFLAGARLIPRIPSYEICGCFLTSKPSISIWTFPQY